MSQPAADLKAAQHLLCEIEEAHRRAQGQLARVQSDGHDHFQQNMAMAHEKLSDDTLDRYTAHARALNA